MMFLIDIDDPAQVLSNGVPSSKFIVNQPEVYNIFAEIDSPYIFEFVGLIAGNGNGNGGGGDGETVEIVYNEIPAGAVNGSNATFTSEFDFVPGKIAVYINGVRQKIISDYQTIGNSIILFSDSPQIGDRIQVDYLKLQ